MVPRTIEAVSADEHPVLERGTFVLSRPHGTVTATGCLDSYSDPSAAIHALETHAVPAIVGALPFRHEHSSALAAPEAFERTSARWTAPTTLSTLGQFEVESAPDSEHLDRITTAVGVLASTGSPLEKVVLARRLMLSSDVEVDPLAVLAALVASTPAGNGFCVDLTSAGDSFAGKSFVGSTPEVLIRKRGSSVTAHPLAGSAPRHTNVEEDWASGRALAESAKDRKEHAFVVDALRETLSPFCDSLEIPDRPTLTHTPQLWHLGTPLVGRLRNPNVTSLELALALHPTPAVCGTPTELAYETIGELEGDRGFYGGAVGWCDAAGDGEWMVAIRCAEIAADLRHLTAYAGGGIVAESDPEAELAETVTKFGTILRALGVTTA